MKRTRALLLLSVTLAACGGGEQSANGPAQPSPSGSAAAGPVSVRQAILLPGIFDLGTLNAAPPTVPAQVNKDVLTGVEMAARPLIMECLVDPKNRGPEKTTKVTVDASLTDAGVDHKVAGQNLTPAGVACITGALGKFTGAAAGLNAKAAVGGPVAVHLEAEHTVGSSPSVVLGANESSDIAGAIRLALPGWGDCLADWKSAAPRTLSASVKMVKPKPAAPEVAPAEVKFEPAGDATADKVATCLKDKMMALKIKAPASDAVTVPYKFRFVHSGIAEMMLPAATPDVTLAQLDVLRNRQAAEATMANGDRGQAAAAYNTAVDGYKASAKDPNAPKVTVLDLRQKCEALLAADDRLIAAFQRVAAGEETTHKFAADEKAKDPAWGDLEAAAARKLADAQKQLETTKSNRKADEGACPKVK